MVFVALNSCITNYNLYIPVQNMNFIYNMQKKPITIIFCLLQEAIQVDGDVLFGLLKKTQPAVYKHIVSHLH